MESEQPASSTRTILDLSKDDLIILVNKQMKRIKKLDDELKSINSGAKDNVPPSPYIPATPIPAQSTSNTIAETPEEIENLKNELKKFKKGSFLLKQKLDEEVSNKKELSDKYDTEILKLKSQLTDCSCSVGALSENMTDLLNNKVLTLNTSHINEINILNNKINELEKNEKLLLEQLNDIKNNSNNNISNDEIIRLEFDNVRLNKELEIYNDKINNKQIEIGFLNDKINQLENDFKLTKSTIDELENNQSMASNSNNKILLEYNDLKIKFELLKSSNFGVELQLNEVNTLLESKAVELKNSLTRLQDLEQNNINTSEEFNSFIKELESRLLNANNDILNLQETKLSLESKLVTKSSESAIELNKITKESGSLKIKVDELSSELQVKSKEIIELNDKLKELVDLISKNDDSLQNYVVLIEDLEGQVSKYQAEVSAKSTEIENLSASLLEVNKLEETERISIETLRKDILILEERLLSSNSELESSQNISIELREHIKSLEVEDSSYSKQEEKLVKLNDELKELTTKNFENDTQIQTFQNEIEQKLIEISTLNNKLNEEIFSRSALELSCSNLTKAMNELNCKLLDSDSKVLNLEFNLKDSNEEIIKLNQTVFDYEDIKIKSNVEISKLLEQNEILNKQLENLQNSIKDSNSLSESLLDRELTISNLKSELINSKNTTLKLEAEIIEYETNLQLKTDENCNLIKNMAELEELRINTVREYEELKLYFSDTESKLLDLESQIDLKSVEITRLNSLVNSFESSNSEGASEVSKLTLTISDLESQLYINKNQFQEFDLTISTLQLQLSKASEEVNKLKSLVSTLETQLTELTYVSSSKDKDLNELNSKLIESGDIVVCKENIISELSTQTNNLIIDLTKSKDLLSIKISELSSQDQRVSGLEAEIYDISNNSLNLNATISALTAELNSAKENVDELKLEISKIRIELENKSSEISTLTSNLDSYLTNESEIILELRGKISMLENEKSGLLQMQPSIDEVKNELNSQHQKLVDGFEMSMNAITEQLSFASEALISKEDELKDLKLKSSQIEFKLSEDLSIARSQLQAFQDQFSSKDDKVSDLMNTIFSLEERLNKSSRISQDELNSKNIEIEKLKSNLDTIESNYNSEMKLINFSLAEEKRLKEFTENKANSDIFELNQTISALESRLVLEIENFEENVSKVKSQALHIEELIKKEEELSSLCDSLKGELRANSSQNSKLLDEKFFEIKNLNEQISNLHFKINDISNEFASTTNILENLNEVKNNLESDLKLAQEELANMKEASIKFSENTGKLEILNNLNNQLIHDNELKSNEIESLNFSISQIKNDTDNEISNLKLKLDFLNNELNERVNIVNDNDSKLKELSRLSKDMKAMLFEKEHELKQQTELAEMKTNENIQYAARIEKFKAKFADLKTELGKAAQLILEKNAEISSLKEANQVLSDRINELISQSQSNTSEQSSLLNNKVESLNNQLKASKDFIDKLKADLVDVSVLNGKIQDLSDQLVSKVDDNNNLTIKLNDLKAVIERFNLDFSEMKNMHILELRSYENFKNEQDALIVKLKSQLESNSPLQEVDSIEIEKFLAIIVEKDEIINDLKFQLDSNPILKEVDVSSIDEIEKLQNEISNKDMLIEELKVQLDSIPLEKLKAEISGRDEVINNLKSQLESNPIIKEVESSNAEEIEKLQVELSQLKEALSNSDSNTDKIQSELFALESINIELKDKVSILNEKIGFYKSELIEKENMISTLNDEKSKLAAEEKEDKNELNESLKQEKDGYDELKIKYVKLTEQNAKYKQAILKLQEKIVELNNMMNKMSEENNSQLTELNTKHQASELEYEDKLGKCKAYLIKANKTIEDQKKEVEIYNKRFLSAKADIEKHWCYIPPSVQPGALLEVEYVVKSRIDLEDTIWCLVQVLERTTENNPSSPIPTPSGSPTLEFDPNPSTPVVTNIKKLFWTSFPTCLEKLNLSPDIENSPNFPPLYDKTLEKRLKDKFDRNWQEATGSYTQALAEKCAKISMLQEQIDTSSQELSAYKTRAHGVLQQQQEKMEKLTVLASTASKADALAQELADCQVKLASYADIHNQLEVAQKQNEQLSLEIERIKFEFESSEGTKNRLIRTLEIDIEELKELSLKDIESLKSVHHDEVDTLRQEIKSVKQKARSMLEEKESEIQKFSKKNNLTPISSNDNILATPSKSSIDSVLTDMQSTIVSTPMIFKGAERMLSVDKIPAIIKSGRSSTPTNDSELSEENSIVQLAAIQAQRDEELNKHRTYIRRLQQLMSDQESSYSKLNANNEELKVKVIDLECSLKRNGANLEYLKNIIVAWMEGGNQNEILPVISTILQFSPDEIQRIDAKRSQSGILAVVKLLMFK